MKHGEPKCQEEDRNLVFALGHEAFCPHPKFRERAPHGLAHFRILDSSHLDCSIQIVEGFDYGVRSLMINSPFF